MHIKHVFSEKFFLAHEAFKNSCFKMFTFNMALQDRLRTVLFKANPTVPTEVVVNKLMLEKRV